MMLLAIDPGPEQSAWVVLCEGVPVEFGKSANTEILNQLPGLICGCNYAAIEMVASYGMPVGAEVFETCVWIGRFAHALESRGVGVSFIKRPEVKMNLCHTIKGVNDAVIRQALIDRYGPGKDKAIGTKKNPGPLYGMKADEWAALAVGVTWLDKVNAG